MGCCAIIQATHRSSFSIPFPSRFAMVLAVVYRGEATLGQRVLDATRHDTRAMEGEMSARLESYFEYLFHINQRNKGKTITFRIARESSSILRCSAACVLSCDSCSFFT